MRKPSSKKFDSSNFERYQQEAEKYVEDIHLFLSEPSNFENINLEIDNKISDLLDRCSEILKKEDKELNSNIDVNDPNWLKCYNSYSSLYKKFDSYRKSIDDALSHAWRSMLFEQTELNKKREEALNNSIMQINKLRDELVTVNSENEKLKKDLDITKSTLNSTSDRFITIVTLLVTLIAIIFGNIVQFVGDENCLCWNSVVILNSSILLSSLVIFDIIENIQLFSVSLVSNEDVKKQIKNQRKTLNILSIISICLLLSAIIVAAVFNK